MLMPTEYELTILSTELLVITSGIFWSLSNEIYIKKFEWYSLYSHFTLKHSLLLYKIKEKYTTRPNPWKREKYLPEDIT